MTGSVSGAGLQLSFIDCAFGWTSDKRFLATLALLPAVVLAPALGILIATY